MASLRMVIHWIWNNLWNIVLGWTVLGLLASMQDHPDHAVATTTILTRTNHSLASVAPQKQQDEATTRNNDVRASFHGEDSTRTTTPTTRNMANQSVAAGHRQQQDQQEEPLPKIAYVVTVTSCGSNSNATTTTNGAAHAFEIAEGAAVLAHSIHVQHQRQRHNSSQHDRYRDYDLVVLHPPEAQSCVSVLAELGFTTQLERPVFVQVEDIQGDFLRSTIRTSGCCGERELLKLEAYSLTHYSAVVLLDLDCLLLQPLFALFDFLLYHTPLPSSHLQWPNYESEAPPVASTTHATDDDTVSLLYTLDYSMVAPMRRMKPMQGGFLVLRPDIEIYRELQHLVVVGDYRQRGGWGGQTGKYWGGHTVQGLLPYYYFVWQYQQQEQEKEKQHNSSLPIQQPDDHKNKNGTVTPSAQQPPSPRRRSLKRAVELNRCMYNNMAQNPRTNDGQCFVPHQEPCHDCRLWNVSQIVSTHFTNCQKPWHCQRALQSNALCRALHEAWFRVRSQMEQGWGRSGWGSAPTWADVHHFYGYCRRRGIQGYEYIARPYGQPV